MEQPISGDGQDPSNPNNGNNPSDDLKTDGPGQDDLSNTKTPEQIEQERKVAITEAVKNHKEAKAAKEEANFLKKVNLVLKDPNRLIEIHSENPELADKIALEIYNKSYNALLQEAQGKGNETQNVQQVVQETLAKERQKEELKRVEDFEERFFADKSIIPGSELYSKIMKVYDKYPHNTVELASNLLQMAYNLHSNNQPPANPPSPGITPPAPAGGAPSSFGPTPKKKGGAQLSASQQGVINKLGLTPQDLEKYGNK